MPTIVKKVCRASKSRTIVWGHIQLAAGAAVTALGFLNPATFPDLPKWAYGLAAMAAAVITYILRNKTVAPLSSEDQKDASN